MAARARPRAPNQTSLRAPVGTALHTIIELSIKESEGGDEESLDTEEEFRADAILSIISAESSRLCEESSENVLWSMHALAELEDFGILERISCAVPRAANGRYGISLNKHNVVTCVENTFCALQPNDIVFAVNGRCINGEKLESNVPAKSEVIALDAMRPLCSPHLLYRLQGSRDVVQPPSTSRRPRVEQVSRMWHRRGLGSKPAKLGTASSSPARATCAEQPPRPRGAVIVSRSEDYMAAHRSDGLFSFRRSAESKRSDRRSAENACSGRRSSDSQPTRHECRRSDTPQRSRRSDELTGPSRRLDRLLASRRSDPVPGTRPWRKTRKSASCTPIIVSKSGVADASTESATPAMTSGNLTGPTAVLPVASAASSGTGASGSSKAGLAGTFASRSTAVARLGSIRVRNLARRRPANVPEAVDVPRASADPQAFSTPLYV